jgi:putative heme-binding domain-containing protein
LYPSAAISHNYASYLVETDSGNSVTGLLTSQTDDAVTITNAEGIAKTIPAKSIDVMEEQSISLMPSNLNQLMTEQELIDVVEYALSLKK